MSVIVEAPFGVQTPRLRIGPRWRTTEGEDARFLAASYGLVPDEWQGSCVDDTLAIRGDGRWTSTRVGWSVPRQNGKNGGIEMVELYKMVMLGRKILHSAHEIKTARKAFLRLCSFFENERDFPELAALVDVIRKTNGQESILLLNGGSCEFIARSKGSGRGFTADDLVMDEAQELDDVTYAALLPTISASPSGNPQQLIVGTPPGPANNGEVFTRLRLDALSGKSNRTLWLEWSFEPGCDSDDRVEWARANPALGIRLGLEVIEDERAAMDEETFRRERGGEWAVGGSPPVIDPVTWTSLMDPYSQPAASLALGVDMTPEGTVTSIGIAGLRADDLWHIELVENREGSAWVVDRVYKIVAAHGFGAVVIDGASPASALVEPLRRKGVIVTTTGPAQMGAACSSLYQLLYEQGLRHLGQPQLASAMAFARKRAIGGEGLWGWGRAVSEADISPTVAVTLALWGAMSTTTKGQQRRRTGRGLFTG